MHRCKWQEKLPQLSLADLRSLLGGLQVLLDLGFSEVADVSDVLNISREHFRERGGPEHRIARQADGHPTVILRRSPPDGEIVKNVRNGTVFILTGRQEHAYTEVEVEGESIVGWAKTVNLQQSCLTREYDDELRSICVQDEAKGTRTFFFVKAECLRTSTQSKLPHFQELLDWGWLEKRSFYPEELYRREWVDEFLAVSHRWEDAQDPDPDGTQLEQIRKFMNEEAAGKRVKLMWYDFWCAPQGKSRTRAEWTYFRWVLKNMDMLYLGGTVLLLVDMSYMSRFWTEFEAWLSMQSCSETGLHPSPDERRSHILCIHNATVGVEDEKLRRMWEHKRPEDAYEILKSPDVPVTNKSDKDSKLALIQELGKEVTKSYTRQEAVRLLHTGKYKVQNLQHMGFSLECQHAVLQGLCESGFSRVQLREFGFTFWQLMKVGVEVEAGVFVITASEDTTAKIWDTVTGECAQTFSGHKSYVNSAVFSADGSSVLTASGDNTAKIWNTATGRCTQTFSGHKNPVFSAVFSADGSSVLTASGDNTAKIWNTTTGRCTQAFSGHKGHKNPVFSAVFSADERSVLTASGDKTAKIWNTAAEWCNQTFSGHTGRVKSAVFSADERSVLTASGDNTAKIWNTTTGTCTQTFSGHKDLVFSAVFSADERSVLTASGDKTAKLWNTAAGLCTQTFSGHKGAITRASFARVNYLPQRLHDFACWHGK